MRLNEAKWVTATGFGIVALAPVFVALGQPVAAWITVEVGLGVAVVGLVTVLRGGSGAERREREHERIVRKNALENELDSLSARLLQIDAEVSTKGQFTKVAENYGDALRGDVLAGETASLNAERASVDRRLAQIATELETL